MLRSQAKTGCYVSSEFGVRLGTHQGFLYSERTANEKQKEFWVFSHWTIFLVAKILNQLEVSRMGIDLPRSVLVCWNYRGKPRFLGSELKQIWYHRQRASSPLWFWLFPSIFFCLTIDQYRAAGQNPGAAGKADKGNDWVVKVNVSQDFPVKP